MARPTHAVPVRLAAVDPADEDGSWPAGGARRRVRRAAMAAGATALVLLGAALVAGLRGAPPAEVPLAVAAPTAAMAPAAESAAVPPGSAVGEGGAAQRPPARPAEASSAEPSPAEPPPAGVADGGARAPQVAGQAVEDPRPVPGAWRAVSDDWRAVVEELDARRAEAFERADPGVLELVYVEGSDPLASDRAVLDALTAGGLTVRGARHVVDEVTLLEEVPGRARVRVTDVLAEHQLVDATGAVVEERAVAAAATVELELIQTDGAWRIGSVSRG